VRETGGVYCGDCDQKLLTGQPLPHAPCPACGGTHRVFVLIMAGQRVVAP
jgi:hypothetical protein